MKYVPFRSWQIDQNLQKSPGALAARTQSFLARSFLAFAGVTLLLNADADFVPMSQRTSKALSSLSQKFNQ